MSCKCGATGESSGARTDFQYAVKIVCGQVGAPKPWPLPHGRYFTATNVHNPSRCDAVTLRWKVAIGLPGLRSGTVTAFAEATLGPDQALEIDCSDVKTAIERAGLHAPPYVKGWVVIESPAELDVVAVYGTSTNADDPVKAFHTERVPARCLPVCDDFALDVSTGVADWQVKRPGDTHFVQTTIGKLHQAWTNAPAGSLWVSPGMEDAGDYTYRLSFKLCSGFTAPDLKLDLLADDAAKLFLNGQPLAGTGVANFTTPTTWTANPAHFKAGDNHLDIVVHNDAVVTGIALHGDLEVKRGLCAGAPMPLLGCPRICYDVYSRHFIPQSGGGWWSGFGCDGADVGTTGQNRRAQAFRAYLTGAVPPGTTIEYRGHMQGQGWTAWIPENGVCGILNQPKRLEAIEMRLVNAPLCCHLSYAVHTRKDIFGGGGGGWGPWTPAAQTAGTTGENRRMEAMRAQIICG